MEVIDSMMGVCYLYSSFGIMEVDMLNIIKYFAGEIRIMINGSNQ
jgi:hypothetical protein